MITNNLRILIAGALIAASAFATADEPITHDYKPIPLTAQQLKTLQTFPQKITKTVNGVTFDSDYDNGSLLNVVAGSGTDTFNCTLYTESGVIGPRTYWFRFTMTGVAGKTIRLNIDHGNSPRPAVRFPGQPWRRTSSVEAPNSNTILITCAANQDEVEVAFFEPLGMAETHEWVFDLVDASPFATVEDIGTSFLGNSLYMATVTNDAFPSEPKHRVWLHSRAHAGEVTSTHCLIGFLQQVTEDSELGRQLRQNCIFNIVPLENVDGVWAGHTRWDAQGLDPERDWCPGTSQPEVLALKAKVDEFMATDNPIEVALNLHSTVGSYSDTFFFKHVRPSVTAEFEVIQQNYIEALRNATPLFNNNSAQTSQLSACIFIESYFWNNWGKDVMAMTHEGHFYYRITDGQPITGEDYRELGRAQAKALVEYFNLPPAQPEEIREGWILY
jgi:hypothetical protein